jgi:hypothetical protein
VPSWPATVAAGLATGLAISTRTGGIITHAYLLAALLLCALEVFVTQRRLALRYLLQIAARYGAVVIIAWGTAIALWPWLQIGHPLRQFRIALVHFASIPMTYEFSHWGQRIWTSELPASYIPAQLLARLPEAFLLLLAIALVYSIAAGIVLAREAAQRWREDRGAIVREAALAVARKRAILLVCMAVILPLAFLIVQRATLYDGIRHVLFIIPMLAILAGLGMRVLLPLVRRVPVVAAVAAGAYVGNIVSTLVALHPLEYVATNALAGGTRGAYGNFELDYWSVAASEALRHLERRLDYGPSVRGAESPPSVMICIPSREQVIEPMLKRPWVVGTDPDKADFVIATERWRCGEDKPLILIDEVKRFDRTFAWIYARRFDDR